MAGSDLFDQFDEIVKQEIGPWLRAHNFSGRGRRFHRTLTERQTLLLWIKTSKWNRLEREHFDFIVNAYIVEEDSRQLIWFWDLLIDGFGISPKEDPGYTGWQRLNFHSDPMRVAREIEEAIERSLIPAALQESEDASGPPIAVTRIGHSGETS